MNKALVVVFILLSATGAHAGNDELVKKLADNLCEPQPPESETETKVRVDLEVALFRLLSKMNGMGFNPAVPCDSVDVCTYYVSQYHSYLAYYQNQVQQLQGTLPKLQKMVEDTKNLEAGGSLDEDAIKRVKKDYSYVYNDAKYLQANVDNLQKQIDNYLRIPDPPQVQIIKLSRQAEYYKAEAKLAQDFVAWLENGGHGPLSGNLYYQDYVSRGQSNLDKYLIWIKQNQDKIQSTTDGLAGAEVLLAKFQQQTIQDPPTFEEQLATLKKFEDSFSQKMPTQLRKPPCGLSIAEAFVIRDYTGSGFGRVNHDIRATWGGIRHGHKKIAQKIYMAVMESALRKLRPFYGTVYRGAGFSQAVVDKMQVGHNISYSTVVSTGLYNAFPGNVVMEIHSTRGRYIQPFSNYPGEYEVLFPSPSRFRVVERHEDQGKVRLVLQEIEPLTFLPNDDEAEVREQVNEYGLQYD